MPSGAATAARSTGAHERDASAAEVRRAQAALDRARLNCSYARVLAPCDGWVTRKAVEEGAYVQQSQTLLAVVRPGVWVTANFKETQLAHLRPGQAVSVAVDAYPGRTLRAHVTSIQAGSGARFSLLPPENATGNYIKVVQRVPVKIEFDPDQRVNDGKLLLGPGMSVTPVVRVDDRGQPMSVVSGGP